MASKTPDPSRRYKNRRGDLHDKNCPSRGVLDHITLRWASLLLILLHDKPHRFNELVRGIGGVSEKVLAQTLKILEADGFVLRTVFPTLPPSVEYSLTPLGRDLAAHVRSLAHWVEDHLLEVLKFRESRSTPR